MEICDSEGIKVYILTKRILFSVMPIVSPGVVASEKAYELYGSMYGGKSAPDVVDTLHKMAESGDIDTQSLLDWEYYQPRYDTRPDVREAIEWFELTAKQGDREAPLALGGIYYDSEQVRVDYTKAYAPLNQAAWHGVNLVWSRLGIMYANGQHVEVDCEKAKEYLDKGVHIYGGPEDFLATCRKDMIDRKTVDDTLPVITATRSGMRDDFLDKGFSCMDNLFATTNKLGKVANLRVTLSICRPSGKEINQTAGFVPFGLNRLNISFTDHLFGSFTSSSSLILYKPEFERKSCATVGTTIAAATATINGKDVELLKAGVIEQRW